MAVLSVRCCVTHWAVENLSTLQTFRSNSNDFCFTDRGFNFSARRVIIPRTTAQLEINISDRSCVTNATYRTGTRQLGIWLYLKGNLSLCTRLVSHICHAGAVANVDFKLCRSSWDDHTTSWKVETSISEAKIVRIGAESSKIFPNRPEKWANGLSFFALEGKIEQQIRISARKRPRGPGLSKQQCQALTSSIESYNKYLKPPSPLPLKKKTTKLVKWTTETRQG